LRLTKVPGGAPRQAECLQLADAPEIVADERRELALLASLSRRGARDPPPALLHRDECQRATGGQHEAERDVKPDEHNENGREQGQRLQQANEGAIQSAAQTRGVIDHTRKELADVARFVEAKRLSEHVREESGRKRNSTRLPSPLSTITCAYSAAPANATATNRALSTTTPGSGASVTQDGWQGGRALHSGSRRST
jgi:hypothetical protein